MSRRDTMRDPRYSMILLQIERTLHDADRLAATRGVPLTDSNIRSLLIRASNEAKGKTVKSTETAPSEKDRFLAETQRQLAAVRTAIVEARDGPDGLSELGPLSASDWIASLEAIKDSCAIRTGRETGSRGYLEFLRDFLKNPGASR